MLHRTGATFLRSSSSSSAHQQQQQQQQQPYNIISSSSSSSTTPYYQSQQFNLASNQQAVLYSQQQQQRQLLYQQQNTLMFNKLRFLPIDVRINILDFVDIDLGVFNFDMVMLGQVLFCLFTRNKAGATTMITANGGGTNTNSSTLSSSNKITNSNNTTNNNSAAGKRAILVFRNAQMKSFQCTPLLPLLNQMNSLNCTEMALNQLSTICTYWHQLKSLTIGYQSKIVDQWVSCLLEMGSLKQLSVESCERLSHNGLANLFMHPSIEKMRLNRVTFSSLEIFNRLRMGNRVLKNLELSHRNGDLWLGDETFLILSQHSSIRHLCLSNFLIRESYAWLSSPDCKLQSFSLANCEIQNHLSFMEELCKNTSIVNLNFAIQPGMKFEILSPLASKKNLKRLEVDSGIWFHEIESREMLMFRNVLTSMGIQFIEWP